MPQVAALYFAGSQWKSPAALAGVAALVFVGWSYFTTAAPLRPDLVDTGANLSAARFREIVERLGLNYSRYELRENLIDVQLLKARNEIAHGQHVEVGTQEFLALHREMESLIREFREDLLVAAQTNGYRRP